MNWRFNEPKCAQSKQESNMENPVRKALENLLAANDRVTKARASVNSNLLNSAIAGQEIAENEARSVLRFTTNVDIDKPDAWQYRCHVGGWLNWREVDEPIDQFVKRNNFNIHNGTCEIRKLYALPSEAKNKYHIKSSNNNLVIELEKYRAKYRNEWCIATPSLSWDDFNLIVTALRAVPDGAAG
ncbi:MAG: hypothetical protein KGI58_03845, partial [Patescibacteria group bacterium]|nr:hypothetical protein [Patescibacteria group bacterium]